MSKLSIVKAIEQRWYGKAGVLKLLLPFEYLFGSMSQARKHFQRQHAKAFTVPVIVVGNISVGGTGKTPTLIALVKFLQSKGLRPGVVSRGYGRKSNQLAFAHLDDGPETIGDEPALIYRATKCDVAVSADRVEAVEALIQQCQCDIVLADDGLQHYKMYRDAEIAVIDGLRRFGNGHLFPVGPLREAPQRLQGCRWVLVNGADEASPSPITHDACFPIEISVKGLTHIASGKHFGVEKMAQLDNIVAIAGIGNPEKFFHTLRQLNLSFEPRPFPDHHQYCESDLKVEEGASVLMTEKDAVKCEALVDDNAYYLDIVMDIPEQMLKELHAFVLEQKQARRA